MEKKNAPAVAEMNRLYSWYRQHQRPLNFRQSTNPYRIYVSEIMLQQTRAESMQQHFAKFITAFPTVSVLARARLDTVLRAWSGLGYYARAKNLHKSAKIVVREYRGRLPRNLDALLSLPGVGPYTARAILSLAFRLSFAVVDANIQRVLRRYYWAEQGAGEMQETQAMTRLREFQACADHWLTIGLEVARSNSALHNQALMELGAVICRPLQPSCGICPFRASCCSGAAQMNSSEAAQAAGNIISRVRKEMPTHLKRMEIGQRKRAPIPVDWLSFVMPNSTAEDRRVLTAKSGSFPFLKDYWHFPYLVTPPSESTEWFSAAVQQQDVEDTEAKLAAGVAELDAPRVAGAGKVKLTEQGSFSHSITNYHIRVRVFAISDCCKPEYLLHKMSRILSSHEKTSFPSLSLESMQWKWQDLSKLVWQSSLNKKIVRLLQSK